MGSAETFQRRLKASVVGESDWMDATDELPGGPGGRHAETVSINESPEPLVGRLGPCYGHSEGIAYKPLCGEVAMCWRVGRMGPNK